MIFISYYKGIYLFENNIIISINLFNCFFICSNVASSHSTLMVIRDIVISSVGPTVKEFRLYNLVENRSAILAKTLGNFPHI